MTAVPCKPAPAPQMGIRAWPLGSGGWGVLRHGVGSFRKSDQQNLVPSIKREANGCVSQAGLPAAGGTLTRPDAALREGCWCLSGQARDQASTAAPLPRQPTCPCLPRLFLWDLPGPQPERSPRNGLLMQTHTDPLPQETPPHVQGDNRAASHRPARGEQILDVSVRKHMFPAPHSCSPSLSPHLASHPTSALPSSPGLGSRTFRKQRLGPW